MKLGMAVLAALVLAGCYRPAGSEPRDAAWVNMPDGVLIVHTLVDYSQAPMGPMDHSIPTRVDRMQFSAWRLAVSGDVARMGPVPVRYVYRGDGPVPFSLVATSATPTDPVLLPLTCYPTWGLTVSAEGVSCNEGTAPGIAMLGARFMPFAVMGTTLRFGQGNACAVDLAQLNPDAAVAIPMAELSEIDPTQVLPRFALAPVDPRTAYLVDHSRPGAPLYLLECSQVTPLGPVYDAAGPFVQGRHTVVDVVPDGALDTPAVLSSEEQDGPPPPFQMRVRRGDGTVIPIERIIADNPDQYEFVFQGAPTGFFAQDPDVLLYNATVEQVGNSVQANLWLYHVVEGREELRRLRVASRFRWPDQ